jgi:hypothetical protein
VIILLNEYYSANQTQNNEIGWACRTCGRRGSYGVLVGKHEGKRPLGRSRHRWVANINMDLQEVGWKHMNYTDLAQDRGPCERDNKPSGSIICGKFLK